MLVKGLVQKEAGDILTKSKEERYGENAKGVRNSFELGNLIMEFCDCDKLAVEIAENAAKSSENKGDVVDTTFRLSADVDQKLTELAADTKSGKIAVVRAIISLRRKELDNGVSKFSVANLTESLLDNSSEKSPMKKLLTHFANQDRESVEDKLKNRAATLYKSGVKFMYYDVQGLYKLLLLHHALNCSGERPLYRLNDNGKVEMDINSSRDKAPNYIYTLKKDIFGSSYINYLNKDKLNIGNRHKDKEHLLEQILNNRPLQELAALAYSPAGMIPVPKHFNEIKGIITTTDTFEEMLGVVADWDNIPDEVKDRYNCIIESYNKRNPDAELPLLDTDLIDCWIQFYKVARREAALQDYYDLEDGRLIVNRFILPKSPEDYTEMIRNINSRILARAYRLSLRL